MPPSSTTLPRRLDQLDRIAVRVLALDLLPRWTRLHRVSEMRAVLLQDGDERRKIRHPKHDAVPTAGLLRLAVGHRAGSGCARPAEQNIHATERNGRKLRTL